MLLSGSMLFDKLINEFRYYEAKREESEKAGSCQESNPGHIWLEPPVVLCHWAITAGQPTTLTILYIYCTGGTECLMQLHSRQPWSQYRPDKLPATSTSMICVLLMHQIFKCCHCILHKMQTAWNELDQKILVSKQVFGCTTATYKLVKATSQGAHSNWSFVLWIILDHG